MGEKFGSIQVRDGEAELVARLAPGHTVRQETPGWVSVLDRDFQCGSTHQEARRLSAALPENTVLSVEYFDDDFVEFALYRAGKKAARHIPATYEGIDRHVGRMADFKDLLALDGEDEKLLRLIFRETDPEVSVHLMESLLGCPIWMDPEAPRPPETARDRAYLESYAARKRQRVKNHTRLTVTDEGEVYLPLFHLTYPIQRRRDGKSTELWGVDGEGRMCPWGRGEAIERGKGTLEGFPPGGGDWRMPELTDGETGLRYGVCGWHSLQVADSTGACLARLELPETALVSLLCILPGVGAVIMTSDSTLEVYGSDLTLLSRHRTKGWILGALPRRDGGVSILTYRQGRAAEPDWAWVYRLGK